MSDLRDYLSSVDEDLGSQLRNLWAAAKGGIHDHVKTGEGHQGGAPHSEAVEDNIWRLLVETKQEKRPIELFILSAAAALHDAGKVPFGDDYDPLMDHGELSERRIRKHAEAYGLEHHQAAVVGMVARPHNNGQLFSSLREKRALGKHGEVPIRKLAAILRLADVLHIDHRVSPQVDSSDSQDDKIRNKTLFRKCVSGWRLVDGGEAIQLDCEATTTTEYDAVLSGVELTAFDIEPIAAILSVNGFPYRFSAPEIDIDQLVWDEAAKSKAAVATIGLDYFHENDAEAFKGRDRETTELLGRVLAHPVSLLVGESGSGKTSIILAGLFAKLKRTGWHCIYARPRLSENTIIHSEDVVNTSTSCTEFVRRAVSAHEGKKLLICLDQFEDAAQLLLGEARADLRRALSFAESGELQDLRVLVSYRVEAESTFGTLWQSVSGSAKGLERTYLSPLNRDGANEALLDALRRKNVALETKSFLERLLDDLELETLLAGYTEGVYPPYLRILLQTVVANTKGKFTEEDYEALGGAHQIIGNYLLMTLDQLGNEKEVAERILRALSNSTGRKTTQTLENISAEAQIGLRETRRLLPRLINMRLVRRINTEYEIAHDYLANLVHASCGLDEIELKSLREMLAAKARAYQMTRELLTASERRSLYRYRLQIVPSADQQAFILRSLLIDPKHNAGPGWFWLRDWNRQMVVEKLYEMLTEDNGYVRRAAVEALARLGSPHDLERIEPKLKDPNCDVREAAVRAVVRLGSRDNMPTIKRMLKDRSYVVRHAVIVAFAEWATQEDFPQVRLMLEGEDRATRRAGVAALARLGTRDDLPRIEQMLEDPDRDVRWAAMQAFASLATRDDLYTIESMLDSTNYHIRCAGVCAFANLATRNDRPKIRQMLEHSDSAVRRAATEAFANLAIPDDLPRLRGMLHDKDTGIRCAAVTAIGKLGTNDDLPDMERMLSDLDNDVRIAALEALAQLGGRQAARQLLEEHSRVSEDLIAALDRFAYLSDDLHPLFAGRKQDFPFIQTKSRLYKQVQV